MNIETKFTSKEINLLLWKHSETLSTAESCTGGNIAAAITAIAGSSNYYLGGLVCYTDEMKVKYLNVKQETIDEHTVYSEEVAREMVNGALEAFGSTYAVAVTGIAGPTGAVDGIPVGTIWIAVGTKDEIVVSKRKTDDGRDRNIQFAACEALEMLLELIRKNHPEETAQAEQ